MTSSTQTQQYSFFVGIHQRSRQAILVATCVMFLSLYAQAQSPEQVEVHYQEGRFGEAIRGYHRLLRNDAGNRDYRWRLANALYIRQYWAKAMQQLRILLADNPSDEEALNLLALVAEHTQAWAYASAAYAQLLAINADNESAEAGLQRIRQAQQNAE